MGRIKKHTFGVVQTKNILMACCDGPIKQIGSHLGLHRGKQHEFGCRSFLFPGISKRKELFQMDNSLGRYMSSRNRKTIVA